MNPSTLSLRPLASLSAMSTATVALLTPDAAQAKCNVTVELNNQTHEEHKDDIHVEPGVAVKVTLKH